jgi:hypothetical protein
LYMVCCKPSRSVTLYAMTRSTKKRWYKKHARLLNQKIATRMSSITPTYLLSAKQASIESSLLLKVVKSSACKVQGCDENDWKCDRSEIVLRIPHYRNRKCIPASLARLVWLGFVILMMLNPSIQFFVKQGSI